MHRVRGGHSDVNLLCAISKGDLSVLGTPPLSNVQARQYLHTGEEGLVHTQWERHDVVQNAVDAEADPVLGSEDFAYMLEEQPGCYIFLGNGAGDGACRIHNPGYDFNDDAIALGATYWVKLAQAFLRHPVS